MKRQVARWVAAVIFVLAIAQAAEAEEFISIGPRAMGMGGAGVALTRGSLSTYWNPAALAPPRSFADQGAFDFDIHMTISGVATENVLAQLEELADTADSVNFDGFEQSIEAGRALTPTEIQDILRLAEQIPGILGSGAGVLSNASPGLSLRVGGLGLSANVFAYGGGVTNLDTTALAIGNTGIENIITGGGAPASAAGQDFATDLAQRLAGQGVPDAARVAGELVSQAETAGIAVDDPQFQDIVDGIIDATSSASGGGGDDFFSANQTGVNVTGILLQEYGVSYAYPFFSLVSVGATAKMMVGTTYYSPFTLGNLENYGDIFKALSDGIDESDINVGIDLGILVMPLDWLSFGLVAKNLNRPSFDSASPSGKYNIDQQVRAGVGVGPLFGLSFALDVDLLKNHTDSLAGFDSQIIAAGLEYNLLGFMSLRGGLSRNMAESFEDLAVHAGLGVQFLGVSLEAAGMMSTDLAEIDSSGTEIPERAGVSILFSVSVPLP